MKLAAQVARPLRQAVAGPSRLAACLNNHTRRYPRRAYSVEATSLNKAQDAPNKTLAQVLADSIKSSGPLSVSTFMRTCLLDPALGYYGSANSPASNDPSSSRQVLGAKGDFITSPEISQVFGELLAVFFVAKWQASELCDTTRLIELGPGKGTLLADMLRTFSRFDGFFQTIKEIHLVETSPGLMAMQHDAIRDALTKAGKKIVGADQEVLQANEIRVEWFPLVDGVPIKADTWSMVVAHEFFDALPTHIFERTGDGFREVLVDVDRPSQRKGGITVLKPGDIALARSARSTNTPTEVGPPKFRYVLSSSATPWSTLLAARNPRFQVLQPGQRVEISPEGWAAARRVGELVAGRAARGVESQEKKDGAAIKAKEADRLKQDTKGGAGLIIDYGDEKAFGSSFRAFKSHQIVDPLTAPGTADLTANVDFLHLKSAIATSDARSLGPMFQSHFLKALGMDQRVDALTKNATDDKRKKEMISAANRLVDPTGMGAQYKVMGITAEQTKAGESSAEGNKCYPFEM
jgi:SAM-dependent MidA family methyltransferase